MSIASSTPGDPFRAATGPVAPMLESPMPSRPGVFPAQNEFYYAAGAPAGLTIRAELSRAPTRTKVHSGSVREQHQKGIAQPIQADRIPVQEQDEDAPSPAPTEVASAEELG